MSYNSRRFIRIVKLLVAGLSVFCLCWIISVNEWHGRVPWDVMSRDGSRGGLVTMRTIVAYSKGKIAEMERPSLVTCGRVPAFPKIVKVKQSWHAGGQGVRWQRVLDRRVSLYSAYYDARAHQHYVRILALFYGRNFSKEEPLYCQTRGLGPFEDAVEVVAARPLEIWWHEWDRTTPGVQTPLLLSCPLSGPLTYSSIVSVINEPCEDPLVAFQLDVEEKDFLPVRDFTICVKDMNFKTDISQNLVEWIEINKLLGVGVIDVYIDEVHNNTAKVLEYYRDKGFLRLFYVPIKQDSNKSLWQRRRDHVITYNDCLYRNIDQSKFIIPLDIDEVLLPKIADTLPELLQRLATKHSWNDNLNSAIIIHNVFFFDIFQKNSKQNINNYKNELVRSNISKIYAKRDDVRLSNSRNVETHNTNLPTSINLNLANNKETEKLRNKYKFRCGHELPEPKITRHTMRSAVVSPIGDYSKSLMVTRKVLTAFNHYPLDILGVSDFGWPAPLSEVQLNHYKAVCDSSVLSEVECGRYGSRTEPDRFAIRLHRPLVRALLNTLCT